MLVLLSLICCVALVYGEACGAHERVPLVGLDGVTSLDVISNFPVQVIASDDATASSVSLLIGATTTNKAIEFVEGLEVTVLADTSTVDIVVPRQPVYDTICDVQKLGCGCIDDEDCGAETNACRDGVCALRDASLCRPGTRGCSCDPVSSRCFPPFECFTVAKGNTLCAASQGTMVTPSDVLTASAASSPRWTTARVLGTAVGAFPGWAATWAFTSSYVVNRVAANEAETLSCDMLVENAVLAVVVPPSLVSSTVVGVRDGSDTAPASSPAPNTSSPNNTADPIGIAVAASINTVLSCPKGEEFGEAVWIMWDKNNSSRPANDADVRGWVRARHDADAVYFYVRVFDDSIRVQTDDLTKVWEADCVELLFDADKSETSPYTGDDVQYFAVPDSTTTTLVRAGSGATVPDSTVERTVLADGYALAVKVSNADVHNGQSSAGFAVGDTIAFNVGINDIDDGETLGTDVQQVLVWRVPLHFRNTAGWPLLQFVDGSTTTPTMTPPPPTMTPPATTAPTAAPVTVPTTAPPTPPPSAVNPAGTLTVDDTFRDRMVFDAGLAVGKSEARVPLTGRGLAGYVIEGLDPGTSGWNVLGTVGSNGQYQVDLVATLNDAVPWSHARVRYQAFPSVTAQTTTRFAAGCIVGVMSQSELANGLNKDVYNRWTSPLAATIADPEALQWLSVVDDRETVPRLAWQRITSPTVAGNAQALVANLIAAQVPGRKFLLVDFMHSGTARRELADDSMTNRNWTHFQACVDEIRANGAEVGMLYEMWYAADKHRKFTEYYMPFYTGTYLNGSRADLGDMIDTDMYQLDHMIFDVDGTTPSEKGRGVFRRDRTKMMQALLNGFVPLDTPRMPQGDLLSSEVSVSGGVAHRMSRSRECREALVAFHADARGEEIFVPFLGSSPIVHRIGHLEDNGEYGDLTHPSQDSYYGMGLIWQHTAVNILRGLGVFTYEKPYWGNMQVGGGRTWMEVTAQGLEAGDTLTTMRAQLGEGRPSPNRSHYHEVMGFEVSVDGGSTWSGSGFTTVMVAGNQHKVRVTSANGAFPAGTQVRFGFGGATGALFVQEDPPAELFKDWPIVEKSYIANYPGIPVEPFPFSPVFTL